MTGWADKPVRRTYELEVKGEQHDNEDGTSRQAEIAQLAIGDAVILKRDIGNPYDICAVKVLSANGRQLGMISASQARWIGQYLARDRVHDVTISNIWYGEMTAAWHLWLEAVVDSGGEDAPAANDFALKTQPALIHRAPKPSRRSGVRVRASRRKPKAHSYTIWVALAVVFVIAKCAAH